MTTISVRFRLPKNALFHAFAEAMVAAAKIFGGTATVIYQSDSYKEKMNA